MKTIFFVILSVCLFFQLQAQWIPITSSIESNIHAIHFIDETSGFIAGIDGLINKTIDGGGTWANTGYHGSSNNRWYSIFAVNEYDIYTCGSTFNYDRWQNNYAYSVTGGSLWNFQSSWGSAMGLWKEVFFLDETNGWKVGYSSPKGRLSRTTNGITDWSYYYSSDHVLNTVYFVDQNVGWVGCNGGYVLTTSDGGETLNEIVTGIPESLRSIYFVNESIGWAVADADDVGVIIKSSDGGLTWYQVNHPATISLNSIQFINENIGWACGSKVEDLEERGVILYTNDSGENWTEQYVCDELSTLYSLFFINDLTGWAVGYGGIILKTTNAGGTSYETIEEFSSNKHLKSRTFPNPSSNISTIEYELQHSETVSINIYNNIGKKVELFELVQSHGKQQVKWDTKGLPSGIYYYMIRTSKQLASGKIVVTR